MSEKTFGISVLLILLVFCISAVFLIGYAIIIKNNNRTYICTEQERQKTYVCYYDGVNSKGDVPPSVEVILRERGELK